MFQIVTGTSAAWRDVAVSVDQFLVGLFLLIFLFIVPRLSLALPGLALGRDDATLGTAWRVTKRNTWRMFWAYFFCSLPLMAIFGGPAYWLFLHDHSQATVTVIWVMMDLLGIPIGMITVGMLSLSYRHFFERGA